jgi:TatD DNase family protein
MPMPKTRQVSQPQTVELTDTHCHIQFPDYKLPVDQVIEAATEAGVTRLLCVGCSLNDSLQGIQLANKYPKIWATIGLHPHEAKDYVNNAAARQKFTALADEPRVVGIGECGLDYFYEHSSKSDQRKILEFQIELALTQQLPLVFHVREAFDDFWKVFDSYSNIKGVVHSFTGDRSELDQILNRGLYIGLNGIVTFTKNASQIEVIKDIPLSHLVLETDAPFLTPTPYRGTINEPKFISVIAGFLAELRHESPSQIAEITTRNALKLFSLE